MKKLVSCLLVPIATTVFALALSVSAQKEDQAWNKWSNKEAQKILSNSAWSQNQTDTDTSEMFFSPTTDPTKRRTPRPKRTKQG